jgi:hypothetical protein
MTWPCGPCTQADIDLWLAAGPPNRGRARVFVGWARRHKICGKIDIATRPAPVAVPTADVGDLIAIARRLLDDDAIALSDRSPGCW